MVKDRQTHKTEDTMNAEQAAKDDRTAITLGRVVIIGMAILEAIAIAVAFLSKSGHGLK